MPSESHHVFRPLLAYPAQGCCTVAPYNLDVLSLTAGTCTAPQASVRGSTQEGQQMHFCCRPPCCPALPGLLHALHPAHNVAAASMRKEPCGACSFVRSTTVCTACRASCAQCCSSQHQTNPHNTSVAVCDPVCCPTLSPALQFCRLQGLSLGRNGCRALLCSPWLQAASTSAISLKNSSSYHQTTVPYSLPDTAASSAPPGCLPSCSTCSPSKGCHMWKCGKGPQGQSVTAVLAPAALCLCCSWHLTWGLPLRPGTRASAVRAPMRPCTGC